MPTVLDSLNVALHQAVARDERVFLLGEDILDPYGGAFRVTRGISQAYPERVLSTPISEAGIVGLATGMALRGLRPVVEIMFGDFLTLAADQVINHAAKFRYMYNDRVRVPLVIRTPMGGRRGYGPTHSQTLEKHFLGAPGLRVLAPCGLGDPGALLLGAILEDDDPVLFVENKLLYLLPVQETTTSGEVEIVSTLQADGYAPAYTLRVRGAPPATLTLAAYGYMAETARQAMLRLAYEDELFVEVVAPTQLAPFELDAIWASLEYTGKLVTVEEGTHNLGWGAEVAARAAEKFGPRLRATRRLASLDTPVPASRPLEEATLPSVAQIIETCRIIARYS
jgi:acetoin:2,6-dichlorophenolindophenol oxidoreductase subunit beta